MSSRSEVKKNYIYNMIYQVFLIALPLITTPYVSRVLGSEGIGTYSFTLSIVSYFVFAGTLSLSMYGRREVAFHQKNRADRSKAFWQINIIKWITMSISLFIFYFTCIHDTNYGSYFFIFTLELLANMFDISWYYNGIEQFKTLTIRNLIIKTICTACIFIFVDSPDDLWLYILIYCLSNFISSLSLWVILPRTISRAKVTFTETKKHLIPVLILFLPQMATEIYTVLDRTMLGALTNNMSTVGIYEQSQKVIKMALTIITALSPVLSVRIASLYAENKPKEIRTTMKGSFDFTWAFATPIAFGIAGIASDLVPWFMGDEFLDAILIMQVGTLLVFFISIGSAIGQQYLVPTKKQKSYTLSVLLGAGTNLIGNFILIPISGALGAIIASILAEFVVSLTQMFAVRSVISFKEMLAPAKKTLPAGVIMLAVILGLSALLPSSIVTTLIEVVVGAVVYSVILVLFKDTFALETLESAKRIVGKITNKK